MVFDPYAPNPRRRKTVLRTEPRNLLEMTDADRTRIKRYAIPKIGVPPKQGPGFNQTPLIARDADDQMALVKRIREKQKSDDLIASNGRMVSAARKTLDHSDLAQLHAQAVRDKGDGALAELGDFACQLHKADPTACKRWKTAMKRELPGEIKRLEAAVQQIEAEEVKTETLDRNEGKTITDVVAGMLDPDIAERGTLLPIGKDKDGNREFPVLPEVAVEALKAVMLPGHVINGGTVSEQDITNMALNVTGSSLITGKMPRGALGMAVRRKGNGAFGPKFDVDSWDEGVTHLMKEQKGELVGALEHPGVGSIDVPWGEPGTGRSDGYGLSKLIKYHPEVIDDLPWLIRETQVVSTSKNRIRLKSPRTEAAIRLDYDGKKKKWLLTAFEPE